MSKAGGHTRGRSSPEGGSGQTFEEALAQVESIIDRIEAGEVGLEQSLAEYERGVALIQHCRGKLDAAQRQIEDLTRKLDAGGDSDDTGAASAETTSHLPSGRGARSVVSPPPPSQADDAEPPF